MAISPVGVLTRDIWSFYPSQIMGGYADIGATGGQLSYIALFNNDQWGNYLWVIGCSLWSTSLTNVLFEVIQFNPNGLIAPLAPVPIVSNAPLLSGQLQTFFSTACIGTHAGGATNVGNTPYNWAHDWPLGIVAPGQCMGFQTLNTAATLAASIYWWVGPQP